MKPLRPAFVVVLLFPLVGIHPAVADWPTDPATNLPIALGITTPQRNPTVIAAGAGSVTVLWIEGAPLVLPGNRNALRTQRVTDDGTPLWAREGVSLSLALAAEQLISIPDGSGGAIAAWEDIASFDGDIYAQHASAEGENWPVANGFGVPVCQWVGSQFLPDMASDGAGGAILTWMDRRTGLGNVYAQRIRADGTTPWAPGGVTVSEADDAQDYPTLVADGQGGAILAWSDGRSHTDYDLYAQRIDSNGASLWALDGVLLAPTPGDQSLPYAVSDGNGGAILFWHEVHEGAVDIRAQRVGADGTVLWDQAGIAVASGAGDQFISGVLEDGLGGSFVLWEDDASDPAYYVQSVSAEGLLRWPDPVRLTGGPSTPSIPVLAGDGAAGLIASWSEKRTGTFDVYAQRVSAEGNRLWGDQDLLVSSAGGDQRTPAITSVGAGGAVICWEDRRYDPTGDIFAQRVRPDGRLGGPSSPPPPPDGTPLAVFPNPAREGAAVRFILSAPAPVSTVILDTNGRLVLSLPTTVYPTGDNTISWSTHDAAGARLPAGIYFVRVSSPGQSWTKRFAILP